MVAAIFAAFLTSCTEEETLQIIEGSISTNTTWAQGETFIIRGDVMVDNATLTIQPGTTLKFEAGASLSIGYYGAATIIANGTVEKPIVFTSTADVPTAGAWEGVFLYSLASSNTSFKYCQFKYAGTNDYGSLNIDGTSCTFSNNTIQNSKKIGINLVNVDSYFGEMMNNTISDGGGHAIRISAAKLHTIGIGNTITCADNLGVNVYGSSVTGTVTWKKLTVPYFVDDDVYVDNSSLTIEAGSIFKFNTYGSFSIGYYNTASLTANGTALSPIVFTSNATSPAAGAWEGIYFYGNNQSTSSMTYCEVAYAGKTNYEAISIDNTGLTFNNNNVHHSASSGIILDDNSYFVAMNNNTISNCASHAIEIYANNLKTLGTGNAITTATGFGIFVNGGSVTLAGTWKKQSVPFFINSDIFIENTLTIEAGTTFKFGAYGSISTGYYGTAQLNAIGTANSPIVFTSISATPAAGDWNGLYFYGHTSTNTTLDYCEFRYAAKGTDSDRSAVYIEYVNGMTIKNSKFLNSNGWGIYKYNSTLSASSTGNTFTSCSLGNEGTN